MGKYWDYYRDDFDWDDNGELVTPDPDTASRFQSIGFSEAEARQLVESGYMLLPSTNLVVDRYYGGALLSSDLRTRIPLEYFRDDPFQLRSPAWVRSASSMTEVHAIVEQAVSESRKPLLYRGQTRHHALSRARPNPALSIDGLGEVSLLPSVWRRMLSRRPDSFLNFQNLSLLEWSRILYSTWDLNEIRRRQDELNRNGHWVHSVSEMEDCDDPLVSEFGKFRGDLTLEFDQLATPLSTLLQHYGLYSPLLDLTRSLDVAIFFATHRFEGCSVDSRYRFIGTNDRQAVIYLLREDATEMHAHERKRVTDFLNPQRPLRQACVVSGSGPWALNLPADFVIGMIRLDFDLADRGPLSVGDLFPSREDDRFLNALLDAGVDHVTAIDEA